MLLMAGGTLAVVKRRAVNLSSELKTSLYILEINEVLRMRVFSI
jgi:hypothetical protein